MIAGNLVLCYHAVSAGWGAELSVTPERLAHQVDLLLSRGFRPVRFSEVINTPPRERVFAVTFDDAFRSVATLAGPILAQRKIPGTLFVPTDYIEAQAPFSWPGVDRWLTTPHAHEMTPASWDEIRALHTAGWEIGAHSCTHPLLTRTDDSVLRHELVDSRAVCEERLQAPCTSFAYPYGNVDDRVATAAADAGYLAAGALPGEFGSRDPLQWPRIGIYSVDDDRRFRLKVSLGIGRLRASAFWTLYKRARPHDDGSGVLPTPITPATAENPAARRRP